MIAITGPTSGIGKATAVKFAQAGFDLLLIGRNISKLTNLKDELSDYKVKIELVVIDLMSNKEINETFRVNRELFSQVECFINNAGLAKGLSETYTLEDSSIEEMIQTNFTAMVMLSKNIAPYFIQNKKGHIINIGSVAGHHVYPNGNVYCATKHAVKAMNQGLRLDFNGTGIRVSEISPGMVNTNFSHVRLGSQEKADKVYEGMIPLTGEDIAETIFWVYQQPQHVNIEEVVIYPTDQASPTVVFRGK